MHLLSFSRGRLEIARERSCAVRGRVHRVTMHAPRTRSSLCRALSDCHGEWGCFSFLVSPVRPFHRFVFVPCTAHLLSSISPFLVPCPQASLRVLCPVLMFVCVCFQEAFPARLVPREQNLWSKIGHTLPDMSAGPSRPRNT